MFITTLVIFFLVLGSVSMEENRIGLCSNRYFDSFVTLRLGVPRTVIQVTRKIDWSSYHLWEISLKEKTNGYKESDESDISYKLKEGQTPSLYLTQPDICQIKMVAIYEWVDALGQFEWIFEGFIINNDYMKGPQMKYNETKPEIVQDSNPKWKDPPPREVKTKTLNGSGIWLSGLLCRVLDRRIYAIAEPTKSMNSSNRIQYMSQLLINITALKPIEDNKKTIFHYSYEFWLESMNITVFDFLGINCSNIQSTVPTTHWYFVSTKTLFVMVLVLFGSGIIFSVINLILVILRKRQNPDISEDTSGATVSTENTGISIVGKEKSPPTNSKDRKVVSETVIP